MGLALWKKKEQKAKNNEGKWIIKGKESESWIRLVADSIRIDSAAEQRGIDAVIGRQSEINGSYCDVGKHQTRKLCKRQC